MCYKTIHWALIRACIVLLLPTYGWADYPCDGWCACDESQKGMEETCNNSISPCGKNILVIGRYKCDGKKWVGQKDSNSPGGCPCDPPLPMVKPNNSILPK